MADGRNWAERAWWALEGDEDPEEVVGALHHAREELGEMLRWSTYSDSPGRPFLDELHLFLLALEVGMRDDGDTRLRVALDLKPRTNGRPRIDWDQVRQRSRAAAIAERHVEAGMKQEAAIAEALEEMRRDGNGIGLTEDKIEKWLLARRRQQRVIDVSAKS